MNKQVASKTIGKTIFIGFHRYDFAILAMKRDDEGREMIEETEVPNESDYII